VRLVMDSKRDFFNNVGEVGAGVEFRPTSDLNLGMRAEYLYGFYYGDTAQPNPYGPRYHTIRLVLKFDQRLIG
jgi:hypothetical protein